MKNRSGVLLVFIMIFRKKKKNAVFWEYENSAMNDSELSGLNSDLTDHAYK